MRVLLPWNKARKEGEDADDHHYGSDSDSDSDDSSAESSTSSFSSPPSPRAYSSTKHRCVEGEASIVNEQASSSAAAETTAAAVPASHRSSPAVFSSTRKKRGIDQLSGSLHRPAGASSSPSTPSDEKKRCPTDSSVQPQQQQPIPKPAASRQSTPEVSRRQSSNCYAPAAAAHSNSGLDSKPAARPSASLSQQAASEAVATTTMTVGRGRDLRQDPHQQPIRHTGGATVRAQGNRDDIGEGNDDDDDITAETRRSPSYDSNEQEREEDDPAASSSPLYENEPPPPSAQVRLIGPTTKGGAPIVLATHNSSSSSSSYASSMMASSPPPNVQDITHPAKRGGALPRTANPASFDEYDDEVRDNDGADEMEEAFVKGLKGRGLDVVEQEGDGNCLFRAVALQVYGDAEAHSDVRSLVCDFMAKDPAHFGQFVDGETFEAYVARKRLDGVHGNNPELQAVCELFNRPIEVYTPESGHVKPINTFQDQYKTGDIPIRLSYHDGNHYNAVIDPIEPTAGLGLGLPGLRPGLADKLQLSRAKAESDAVQDEAELNRAVKESALAYGRTAADDFQRALKESAFSMDHMYQDKALMLSDLDATNFELEQTALEDSMLAFAAEQGRKQRARIFAGSVGGGGASAEVAAAASTTVAGASRSSRPRRGREEDAFSYSSSEGPFMAAPHASLVPAAASSTTAPTALSSAALASPHAAQSPPRFASSDAARTDPCGGGFGALDAMEYPETVQELVMNGFELSRVVRAYELIGDSFDDLLALLMSQQRQS